MLHNDDQIPGGDRCRPLLRAALLGTWRSSAEALLSLRTGAISPVGTLPQGDRDAAATEDSGQRYFFQHYVRYGATAAMSTAALSTGSPPGNLLLHPRAPPRSKNKDLFPWGTLPQGTGRTHIEPQ